MVSVVLIFGILNVMFEFVLLCMLPPRARLRVLGSPAKQRALHVFFLVANLTIHWGTVIGTMSGVFAFICSIVTVSAARVWFGHITSDDRYKRGVLAYKVSELA